MIGMSVHAQDRYVVTQTNSPTVQYDEDISIEDDLTGSYLIITPSTGNYKFHRCSDGFSMSGTGMVKINGCAISFEDVETDRRVLASVNLCIQEGNAAVEGTAPRIGPGKNKPMKEYLRDVNMSNNTMGCTSNN